MVALGGVVVDDVEDDLDPGRVQRLDHRLELAHLIAGVPGATVVAVRREEAERVVAPVVAEPLLDQMAILHEVVDRQQFDRRDAETLEVADDLGVGEPRVGATQVLRHGGVALGEALDVQFVDDRVVQRGARRARRRPSRKMGSITTQRGMKGALSRWSMLRSAFSSPMV